MDQNKKTRDKPIARELDVAKGPWDISLEGETIYKGTRPLGGATYIGTGSTQMKHSV